MTSKEKITAWIFFLVIFSLVLFVLLSLSLPLSVWLLHKLIYIDRQSALRSSSHTQWCYSNSLESSKRIIIIKAIVWVVVEVVFVIVRVTIWKKKQYKNACSNEEKSLYDHLCYYLLLLIAYERAYYMKTMNDEWQKNVSK